MKIIYFHFTTEDGTFGGGKELINNDGIQKTDNKITVYPDKLNNTIIYYYCSKHKKFGGEINIQTGKEEIDLSGSLVYPTNSLDKRYNVTRFGPKDTLVETNKISYLKHNFKNLKSNQKYLLQCNIWVENLKTANKVQNGSVFIYDGNIKLIRDNSIGITEGSSKIQPNNIYLIYSVNKWYSISTEITTSTT